MRVSAIIPTGNRRHLLPLAIASFLSQDWPDKELVVIDDGDEPEHDLVAHVPRVSYVRVGTMTIGDKRNLACQIATGEVIVHFDSDDWSAPGRITDQVERLLAASAQMSGYHSLFFWNMLTARAYRYNGTPTYSCGTAMCYRKAFWQANRFPDTNHAEDNALVFEARDRGQLVSADGSQMIVARVHDSNVTKAAQRIGYNSWPEVPREALPAAFFEAMAGA